jgi:GMP synthase (glutamine-hydrolysing)
MPEFKILIVDCGTKNIDSIQRIVSEFGFKLQKILLTDLAMMRPTGYSGVIISGSPILLTENHHGEYLKSLGFIRESQIPALGICFGHQIVGLLHGARVFRGSECRTNQNVEVLERNTLFEGLERILSLREDHCEGITLPQEFILLATSESYTVEAMKHRNHQLYGVQFHPEASGEVGYRIIGNFLSLCR